MKRGGGLVGLVQELQKHFKPTRSRQVSVEKEVLTTVQAKLLQMTQNMHDTGMIAFFQKLLNFKFACLIKIMKSVDLIPRSEGPCDTVRAATSLISCRPISKHQTGHKK